MRINIDGVEHHVQPAQEEYITNELKSLATVEYTKLDAKWRLMAKPIAREILRKMEEQVREKRGNEAAMLVRPGKHEDAPLHLLYIFSLLLQEALNNVTISLTTAGDTITTLGLTIPRPGQAGGQMATYGNVGVRQDNEPEVPGCDVRAPFPIDETLYSGLKT